MRELRANTQVIVPIGPAAAVGDGFTPVTTLSLSTADEAELLKHGSTTVVDISGATFAAITSMDGHYGLTLTTSHTDTEGMLRIAINDDSLILPIKEDFMVLSEAAWDSKYVAKDDGFMSVDAVAVDGTLLATDGAIPHLAIVDQGTAQSATASTVVLRAASAFADGVLNGSVIGVHGSTQGYWQFRGISSNTLADDTVNVDSNWTTTPTGTITYKIFGAPPVPTTPPDVNVAAVDSDTDVPTRFKNALKGITYGTVGAASTTTSVVTSALDPAASVTDQFKGKILTFNRDTTTAALRGQSTDVTASTSGGVLTVTALTTAPVSGDTFSIS